MSSLEKLIPCTILFVVLLLASGCYTLLHHPDNGAVRQYIQNASGPTTCGDCHDHASIYRPSGHERWRRPYRPGWGYYDPWWWNNYGYGYGYGYSHWPHHQHGDDYEPGTPVNQAPVGDWWHPRIKRPRDESGNPLLDQTQEGSVQDSQTPPDQGDQNDGDTEEKEPRKKRRGKGR